MKHLKAAGLALPLATAPAVLPLLGPGAARADTTMTAGVVLEKMGGKELFSYVFGLVDGMAYARFRKDTLAAGAKQQDGMNCIYKWFTANDYAAFTKIEDAFRANADYIPPVIVAALIKKECGE